VIDGLLLMSWRCCYIGSSKREADCRFVSEKMKMKRFDELGFVRIIINIQRVIYLPYQYGIRKKMANECSRVYCCSVFIIITVAILIFVYCG